MRIVLTTLIAVLLAVSTLAAQERIELSAGTVLNVTTLADDINYPTAVSVAPDGNVWVSDGYTGNLWRFAPGGLQTLVGTIPLQEKLNDESAYGILFDVEILDEEHNGQLTIITMFSTADNRLRIGKSMYDGVSLTDPEIILDVPNVPFRMGHSMSVLEDGTLIVSVGSFDNTDPSNLNVLSGKLLRMDTDGKAVQDNPMFDSRKPDAPVSYVYSFGHRHLAGATQVPTSWSSIGGRVFAVEPGANGSNEINLVTPGSDHGWRRVSGFCETPSSSFVCPKATLEFVPSCVTFYGSDAIPEWSNTLLVGTMSLYGGMVVADVTSDGDISNIDPALPSDNVMLIDDTRQFIFTSNTGIERPRSVAVGPDGRVFLAVVEYTDGITKGRVMVLENPAVHTPLSVDDLGSGQSGFSFGPNPMQDVLNVRLDEPASSTWSVRIFDLMGRPVVSRSVAMGTTAITLETAQLPTGSYLLVIDDGNRQRSAAIMR